MIVLRTWYEEIAKADFVESQLKPSSYDDELLKSRGLIRRWLLLNSILTKRSNVGMIW